MKSRAAKASGLKWGGVTSFIYMVEVALDGLDSQWVFWNNERA